MVQNKFVALTVSGAVVMGGGYAVYTDAQGHPAKHPIAHSGDGKTVTYPMVGFNRDEAQLGLLALGLGEAGLLVGAACAIDTSKKVPKTLD